MGLHAYYPEKVDENYSFVQIVADNMKLFTKRQVEGVLRARHLYETIGYPSEAVLDILWMPTTGNMKFPRRSITATLDYAFLAHISWRQTYRH